MPSLFYPFVCSHPALHDYTESLLFVLEVAVVQPRTQLLEKVQLVEEGAKGIIIRLQT